MSKVQASARVQVTIELGMSQPWHESATAEEIHRMAKREALEEVARLMKGHASIIGEPRVTMILTEEQP